MEERRKPGRPAKGEDLRDEILDSAEMLFAEHGFSGAAVRDIAAGAGCNPALLRYYFGSKESLFAEVFRRRGSALSGQRHVFLDDLLARPAPPTVEDVIHAYLKPQWEMKYSGASGAAFVKLQARLHAEPAEYALSLRREVYDSSVKRYVSALEDLLPGIPREVISIRMAFLVGAYLFMLNDLGRLSDMTDGQVYEMGKEPMLAHLVIFLSAGLRAPLP